MAPMSEVVVPTNLPDGLKEEESMLKSAGTTLEENLVDGQPVANRYSTVLNLHLAACIFMGIQTIVYGAVDVDLKLQPTAGFQVYCNSNVAGNTCGGSWDRTPALLRLPYMNPIWLMPFFVGLASFDHLVTYTYATYYPESAKYWMYTVGSNPFRWLEYSISASAMVWGITQLCGIHDVHMIMLITVMTALGMLLGFVIEVLPKEDHAEIEKQTCLSFSNMRKGVFGIASASIFVPWLVIMCYFFQSASRPESEMPGFVYGAFLGTLILFICFGANSYMHNILKWYDFETAEIVYVSLSFTAKTFLAADVFGGLRAASN